MKKETETKNMQVSDILAKWLKDECIDSWDITKDEKGYAIVLFRNGVPVSHLEETDMNVGEMLRQILNEAVGIPQCENIEDDMNEKR